MSICALAPFVRLPVSISCGLSVLPPFGFTGVGIMPRVVSGLSKCSASPIVGVRSKRS